MNDPVCLEEALTSANERGRGKVRRFSYKKGGDLAQSEDGGSS